MQPMNHPLVSVICLCFNQEKFIEASVQSILNQTYDAFEIIIVDDASNDQSPDIIRKLVEQNSQIQSIFLPENLGNCKAFNKGLKLAKGEYIIDLAGDDILYEERLEHQIMQFYELEEDYGVVFSDAQYLDQQGKSLRRHFSGPGPRVKIEPVPSGDIYWDIIGTYFIPTPTMMMKKEVLERLGGYETLVHPNAL